MQSDDAIAERFMKRRANTLFLLSMAFILVQGSFIDSKTTTSVDNLRIAWAATAVILLAVFATGGGWRYSPQVRALLNDESTLTHRARAITIAFYNVMAAGTVIYVLSLFKSVTGTQAVHVMMTVGIASALMAFAGLERAALRDAEPQ